MRRSTHRSRPRWRARGCRDTSVAAAWAVSTSVPIIAARSPSASRTRRDDGTDPGARRGRRSDRGVPVGRLPTEHDVRLLGRRVRLHPIVLLLLALQVVDVEAARELRRHVDDPRRRVRRERRPRAAHQLEVREDVGRQLELDAFGRRLPRARRGGGVVDDDPQRRRHEPPAERAHVRDRREVDNLEERIRASGWARACGVGRCAARRRAAAGRHGAMTCGTPAAAKPSTIALPTRRWRPSPARRTAPPAHVHCGGTADAPAAAVAAAAAATRRAGRPGSGATRRAPSPPPLPPSTSPPSSAAWSGAASAGTARHLGDGLRLRPRRGEHEIVRERKVRRQVEHGVPPPGGVVGISPARCVQRAGAPRPAAPAAPRKPRARRVAPMLRAVVDVAQRGGQRGGGRVQRPQLLACDQRVPRRRVVRRRQGRRPPRRPARSASRGCPGRNGAASRLAAARHASRGAGAARRARGHWQSVSASRISAR